MVRNGIIFRRGITIVELIIAMVCSIIVIIAVGVALADSGRGWRKMYERVHADIVEDGQVARRQFDRVIRKASSIAAHTAEDASWIEVYYYDSSGSTELDRYARFFKSDDDLMLETGVLFPKSTTTMRTICSNVQSCAFKHLQKGAEMTLTLNDGEKSNTVVTSAYMHN
jgi:Tfp pilus assembly protein PilW